ncbi:MAG: hypothetical protein Q9197_000315 [Variospora fuerteventurae]
MDNLANILRVHIASSSSAPDWSDSSTPTAVATLKCRSSTKFQFPTPTVRALYSIPRLKSRPPFTTSEPPDLMAATQMQRPYQSVYHTPQSNSPASVASTQSHDPNNRLYGQPPPQIQQPMYGYPQYPGTMNQSYPNAYSQHPSQQQQQHPSQQQQHPSQQQQQQQHPQHTQTPQQHPSMTSQSQMMMPHSQQPHPPMQHPQAQPQASDMASNSPRMKMEPQAIQQRPLDTSSLPQRPTPGPMSTNHSAPAGPHTNGLLHPTQNGGAGGANGVNPNAAPGPIPATTPLVVRQDENGVQWILFEYSRDRVKMEYTIRCDVESVNVDTLAPDFKTENCVYPRACCNKEQYRGNRLAYETECNTVGWALAELNPCLRGKRGLIQRAVDSWRNSNQDPRLRSRRVRRMAKINTRKQAPAQPHPSHLAGPGGPGAPTGVTPSNNPMAAPVQRTQPSTSSMNISSSSSIHQHHAHSDGNVPGGKDEVSASGPYTPQQIHQVLPKQPPHDIRQSQVFHGYPNFPPQSAQGSVSIAPILHDGIDGPLSAHPSLHPANPSSVIAVSAPTTAKMDGGNHDHPAGHRGPSSVTASTTTTHINNKNNNQLFPDIPEAKRRKFIHVEDLDRNNPRQRVGAVFDAVDMSEIPDSYRRDNSVYPRSYFPIQMQSPKRRASRGNRFFQTDGESGGGGGNEEEQEEEEEAVMGRTMVPVPMLEGDEAELPVPRIGRAKRRREEMINDVGYCMSWKQSRLFAGRTMYLQKALDAYRNCMRTAIAAGGRQVETVAPHLETRVGKRKWLARKGGGGGGGGNNARVKMKEEDPDGVVTASLA